MATRKSTHKKKRGGNVFKAAKAMRKKHPRKFKKWTDYVKAASKHKPRKRKVGAKKTAKKKVTPRKRAKAKRKPPTHLVKYVERASTERVMSGKKRKSRKKHRSRPRRQSHRRRVSGAGSSGMNTLLAVGLGVGAAYLLMKGPSSPAPTPTYPALQSSGNVTRDSQASEIVGYAIAAGYAVDAITRLIQSLNTKSDTDINNTYNDLYSGGGDLNDLIA